MAKGKIVHVYDRGTRAATSKFGKLKYDNDELDFTLKEVDPLHNINLMNADQMKDWNVEFKMEKGKIVKGSIKRV